MGAWCTASNMANDDDITLTREALYDLVWSKPMSKLAPEFGISDVALTKRCKRLGIPYPGLGYWARLAAGQKIKRPKLPPPPKNLRPWELAITFKKQPEPALREEPRDEPPPPDVIVRDALRSPHPAVERLRHELAQAQVNHNGLLRVSATRATGTALKIGSDSVKRTLRVLDALFNALEKRGHEVKLDGVGYDRVLELSVIVDGECVRMTVDETVGRRPHVPTEAEIENNKRWGARIPKNDGYPSGQLTLQVRPGRSWADSKVARLEDLLGRVVVDIELAPEAIRRARAEAAQRQAEWEAAERRRLRTQRLNWYQHELARAFERMVNDWRKAQDLQAFVVALEQRIGTAKLDAMTERWLASVKRHARAVDPVEHVERLASELEPSDEVLEVAWREHEAREQRNARARDGIAY